MYGAITIVVAGQIFVPCYCAAIITDRSAKLCHSMYCANWLNLLAQQKWRKIILNVVLFQGQLMQNVTFTTWGAMFEIALPTFVSVRHVILIKHLIYNYKFSLLDHSNCLFVI